MIHLNVSGFCPERSKSLTFSYVRIRHDGWAEFRWRCFCPNSAQVSVITALYFPLAHSLVHTSHLLILSIALPFVGWRSIFLFFQFDVFVRRLMVVYASVFLFLYFIFITLGCSIYWLILLSQHRRWFKYLLEDSQADSSEDCKESINLYETYLAFVISACALWNFEPGLLSVTLASRFCERISGIVRCTLNSHA